MPIDTQPGKKFPAFFGTAKFIILSKKPLTSPQVLSQINTLRTGDADLRFYITTVQDG